MSEIVGVLYTSHGAFTTTPSSEWAGVRARRSFRDDVPVESQDEMDGKWARVLASMRVLREKLAELRPTVLVIVGDDQEECFAFTNHPTIAVYVGEEFTGRVPKSFAASGEPTMATVPGAPSLGRHVLCGLLERGFDPAFMTGLPSTERGISHAIINPLAFYTDFSIPTLPVLLNAYYAPQITARRSCQVGMALGALLREYPGDERIVVVGSGGLWHTPGRPQSWLNEDFDRSALKLLEEADFESWAKLFDEYSPGKDPSQEIDGVGRGVTGLPGVGGPQFGTRETICWLAAGSAAGGKATVVDYIPIYASPVGNAFAYAEL